MKAEKKIRDKTGRIFSSPVVEYRGMILEKDPGEENMVMRKRKRVITWLILTALCLGACGGPTEEKEPAGDETKAFAESAAETESSSPEETEMEESREAKAEEKPYVLSLMTDSQYDHVWEDGKGLCHTKYSRIWLDSREEADPLTGAPAFPQLARALEEMNGEAGEQAASSMEEVEASARELMADGDFSHELYWEEKVWAVRADSHVASFLREGYTYKGGAHGLLGYGGITFDSQTGNKMELEDIVTDTDRLVELAAQRLEEKYQEIGLFESPKEALAEQVENGYAVWTAGYEGLTFYFDPYSLAPYGYGVLTVTIPYQEQPDLFVPKVCEIPASWAVQVTPGMELDLGRDGTLDSVQIYGVENMGSAYEQLQILVNSQESLTDMWCYSYVPYVVHSDDMDTELLIVETTADNDYQVTLVYELDPEKDGFRTPQRVAGTGFFSYFQEKEDGETEYGTQILTDPSHFCMSTRMNLLSTYYGTRWYKVSHSDGEDGYLAPEQPWYDVDRGDDYYLTLRIPLEMETEETGEIREFPAGTKLWIVRVEGNYVGFLTEDGTRCRVWAEQEWPYMVNGMEAEEIFDGMMFAG